MVNKLFEFMHETHPGTPENNHFTEMCSGSEAGSYLRCIDSCITQLKAQGPARTCSESKEEKIVAPGYPRNPKPETETRNPKLETETRNPEPETETRNPKPETRNPKPFFSSLLLSSLELSDTKVYAP